MQPQPDVCLLLRLLAVIPVPALLICPALPCQILSRPEQATPRRPLTALSHLKEFTPLSGEILQVNSCLVGSGP